ncbi:putative transmembrane protein [Gregarina niphandrodes]|uniref:Transmembrane protein n=1 Tax=Gregarina niphandrodes TaxID=110365 RepID=A0A023B265_GRENI|nr:putative transmembrane protein [Gregarina niphandrodes]EZG50651.1 putative transmembrane protein [Gregarina niphandrodes]|eukprot:XP_011131996.1 putative transmembrane protein [Gregarina niphandrodes]
MEGVILQGTLGRLRHPLRCLMTYLAFGVSLLAIPRELLRLGVSVSYLLTAFRQESPWELSDMERVGCAAISDPLECVSSPRCAFVDLQCISDPIGYAQIYLQKDVLQLHDAAGYNWQLLLMSVVPFVLVTFLLINTTKRIERATCVCLITHLLVALIFLGQVTKSDYMVAFKTTFYPGSWQRMLDIKRWVFAAMPGVRTIMYGSNLFYYIGSKFQPLTRKTRRVPITTLVAAVLVAAGSTFIWVLLDQHVIEKHIQLERDISMLDPFIQLRSTDQFSIAKAPLTVATTHLAEYIAYPVALTSTYAANGMGLVIFTNLALRHAIMALLHCRAVAALLQELRVGYYTNITKPLSAVVGVAVVIQALSCIINGLWSGPLLLLEGIRGVCHIMEPALYGIATVAYTLWHRDLTFSHRIALAAKPLLKNTKTRASHDAPRYSLADASHSPKMARSSELRRGLPEYALPNVSAHACARSPKKLLDNVGDHPYSTVWTKRYILGQFIPQLIWMMGVISLLFCPFYEGDAKLTGISPESTSAVPYLYNGGGLILSFGLLILGPLWRCTIVRYLRARLCKTTGYCSAHPNMCTRSTVFGPWRRLRCLSYPSEKPNGSSKLDLNRLHCGLCPSHTELYVHTHPEDPADVASALKDSSGGNPEDSPKPDPTLKDPPMDSTPMDPTAKDQDGSRQEGSRKQDTVPGQRECLACNYEQEQMGFDCYRTQVNQILGVEPGSGRLTKVLFSAPLQWLVPGICLYQVLTTLLENHIDAVPSLDTMLNSTRVYIDDTLVDILRVHNEGDDSTRKTMRFFGSGIAPTTHMAVYRDAIAYTVAIVAVFGLILTSLYAIYKPHFSRLFSKLKKGSANTVPDVVDPTTMNPMAVNPATAVMRQGEEIISGQPRSTPVLVAPAMQPDFGDAGLYDWDIKSIVLAKSETQTHLPLSLRRFRISLAEYFAYSPKELWAKSFAVKISRIY